jgi:hypothetical protein
MPARFLVPRARDIEAGLARLREAGVDPVPNLWQTTLGVYRMWWRLLTRSDTIGTSQDPVRPTLRARLLYARALRFPFLLREQAVNPADFSGLASSPERIIRHLLGAHHDHNQFAYDLEILGCYPGTLDELHGSVRAVVTGESPRAEWLRDLVVHEGYHERLLDAVTHALRGEVPVSAEERDDPDISFLAYLRWCARQPATPKATLSAILAGELSFAPFEAQP